MDRHETVWLDVESIEDAGETEDGVRYTDVWGWDDDTPKGEQSWRLHLYVAE